LIWIKNPLFIWANPNGLVRAVVSITGKSHRDDEYCNIGLQSVGLKIIKTIFPSAPIEAVSSQRSGEIEPKAGIAIANTRGQFAPKESYSLCFEFLLYVFMYKKR
jgi:hypothetical protein